MELELHFEDIFYELTKQDKKHRRQLRRILKGATNIRSHDLDYGRDRLFCFDHQNGHQVLSWARCLEGHPSVVLQLARGTLTASPGVSSFLWQPEPGWSRNLSFREGRVLISRNATVSTAMRLPHQNRIKQRKHRKAFGFSLPSLLGCEYWFKYLPLLKAGISPYTFKPFRPGQQLWVRYVPNPPGPKSHSRICRRVSRMQEHSALGSSSRTRKDWAFGCNSGIFKMGFKMATLCLVKSLVEGVPRDGSVDWAFQATQAVEAQVRRVLEALPPNPRPSEFLTKVHGSFISDPLNLTPQVRQLLNLNPPLKPRRVPRQLGHVTLAHKTITP